MNMASKNHTKKIIIDTDPGVDDAMAIMMALDAHNKGVVEVLAITLVKGNASIKDSERNVLRVLEVFGLVNDVRLSKFELYIVVCFNVIFSILIINY